MDAKLSSIPGGVLLKRHRCVSTQLAAAERSFQEKQWHIHMLNWRRPKENIWCPSQRQVNKNHKFFLFLYQILFISILAEPRFLTSSKNVTVDENETIELVCSIVQELWHSHENKSKLMWLSLNTNTTIEPSESYDVNNRQTSILRIDKVNRNHSGVYMCLLADNPVQSITYSLFVRCIKFWLFDFFWFFNKVYFVKFNPIWLTQINMLRFMLKQKRIFN